MEKLQSDERASVEEAKLIAKSLDKKDITMVKSLKSPPPALKMVVDAVLLLLGRK